MRRMRHGFLFLLALSLFAAIPAGAAPSKLNARARIAIEKLRGGMPASQLITEGNAVSAEGDLDVFIVGSSSRQELEALGVRIRSEVETPYGIVRTAFVPLGAVDAVSGLSSVTRIEGAAPVELELSMSVPTTNASSNRGAGPTFTGMNGAGVLVGDVDSGVDYNHGDFLDAGGNSRFVSIWDQTIAGTPPAGFGYGSEWTTADLDANIATEQDLDGHGTHVLGIAGGDGSQSTTPHLYTGMAPMADLCMVKTTFFTSAILDGVNYVFNRATALGKNAVCNLSLGSHFGPHDGTSAFESGLSGLCGPGRAVVKSAGNERSTTNIRHAQVFAAGAGTNATMTVTGGTTAGRYVAIDGYYEATENVSVQITTPGGTVIGPVPLGAANAAFPGTNTANGNVYLENGLAVTATGDPEVYIEINIVAGDNANGTWTFTFIPVALGPANGEVDLWRFAFITSTANFVIGADNGSELVSEPGNAVELVTTAAWVSRQTWTACTGVVSQFTGTPAPGNLATFSSMGPTRDGRQKPDIAAPGMAILSTRSFDVGLACPASGASTLANDGNNHIANAGTSMAAPHTTGAIALIMQKYGAVTPAFIKSFLSTRAQVDAFTGAVPNYDWGAGKLWLGDMLDPSVAVTYANGGEVLLIGGTATLTYNASDNVGVSTIDIYLSRTGPGGPWTPIVTGVPNTGSQLWLVTGPATTNAYLQVVATDGDGNTTTDLSDNAFEIKDLATATLLSTFEAAAIDRGIELRWQFSDAAGVVSVGVERADQSAGPYQPLGIELRREGNLTVALDATVAAGRTYWYRLSARGRDGSVQSFGPLAGTAGEAILDFALARVWPNPTDRLVRIEYAVPKASDVSLKVLDVQGREVAALASGVHRAGRHQAVWSGETTGGKLAPAGLYFIRMQSGGFQSTRRVVVNY